MTMMLAGFYRRARPPLSPRFASAEIYAFSGFEPPIARRQRTPGLYWSGRLPPRRQEILAMHELPRAIIMPRLICAAGCFYFVGVYRRAATAAVLLASARAPSSAATRRDDRRRHF